MVGTSGWVHEAVHVDEVIGFINFAGLGANPDGATGEFFSLNLSLSENSEVGTQTDVTLNYMKFNSNLVIKDVSAHIDVVVSINQVALPETFVLKRNFPNPFNPSTTIRYGLPDDSNVSLEIYDIRGNHIQTLQSLHQPVGWYDVNWNGETTEGISISTGIYVARLVAGDFRQVNKMLYLEIGSRNANNTSSRP